MKKLVTLGDNCIDVYPALGRGFSGGNAVNVAVYSTRYGMRPAYVGWVGSDAYGQQLQGELAAKGVDVSHVHRRPGLTAQTIVELRGNDRVLGDYTEGVMADFRLSEADLAWLGQFDLIHAGIWGHVDPYLAALKAQGKLISFDFADKWSSPLWQTLPASLAYAFASAPADTPELRGRLREVVQMGADAAVATLGEHGSLAYDGQRFHHQSALPVEIVDTMGAGDAFIAGFLCAVARGLGIAPAMAQGAAGAALTLQHHGAWG
ncbi:fructoselysine 6-kinase [Pseudomonas sp. RIT-PI-S]|uniref:fructoselysine 6-kinase n=1 Tax=Pseudomonas sp. RIT-PI-S TaxID=3035295 RepID=UPI0021DA581C|nr:fructoselysine 6-kinase [Pseudomonas sp. RIT-PI-S]